MRFIPTLNYILFIATCLLASHSTLWSQTINGKVYVPGDEQELPSLNMEMVARGHSVFQNIPIQNEALYDGNANAYSMTFTHPSVHPVEFYYLSTSIEVLPSSIVSDECGIDAQDVAALRNAVVNGAYSFTEGWQKAAADVDNDGSYSGADILALTRLLLGLDNSELFSSVVFCNNMDLEIMKYEGSDVHDVYYANNYELNPLGTDRANVNFGVVKIGDVDKNNGCDFTPNNGTAGEPIDGENTNESFVLKTKDIEIVDGPYVDITFSADSFSRDYTFSLVFEIDTAFEVIGVFGDFAKIEESEYKIEHSKHLLKIVDVCMKDNLQTGTINGSIFTVRLRNKTRDAIGPDHCYLEIADIISLHTEDKLKNLYIPTETLSPQPVVLKFESGVESDKGKLTLWPNPFKACVNTNFKAKGGQLASIVLTDINGRELKQQQQLTVQGQNNIQLVELGDLPKSVYHVSLFLDGKLVNTHSLVN